MDYLTAETAGVTGHRIGCLTISSCGKGRAKVLDCKWGTCCFCEVSVCRPLLVKVTLAHFVPFFAGSVDQAKHQCLAGLSCGAEGNYAASRIQLRFVEREYSDLCMSHTQD